MTDTKGKPMKICGIYGIRNIVDGKWYIGQSVDIYVRKRVHFREFKKGKHFNVHLQSAYTKYGKDKLEFHILEITPIDMLNIRECSWIKYYKSNTAEFGYNMENGGDFNHSVSEETKRRISLANKGREFSREHKQKIAAANKTRCISEETRKKMSISNKTSPLCIANLIKMQKSNLGRIHSDIMRRKVSEANKGRCCAKETRRKIALAHIGMLASKETRLKMSLAHKGRICSGETRNKIRMSKIGAPSSDETKRKISFALSRKHLR